MIFTGWKRERTIHQALRRFAKQHVSAVRQPGNVWVIEKAVDMDEMDALIATCLMRGWIEVLHDAIPHGQLAEIGNLPPSPLDQITPTYCLTETGWAALQRAHLWNLAAVALGVLSLIAAIAAID